MLVEPGRILVTGGAGLVGSTICIAFHQAGFAVRGTTRSDAKAKAWAAKHPDIPVEWAIVPEGGVEGAYDEAAKDCIGCIHAATPVHFYSKDYTDIVEPAVKGTLNLLKAAAKSGTVKRVIYTSSISAVHDHTPSGDDAFLRPGNTYTEESWNPATWDDVQNGPYKNDPGYLYSASKKLAEQAAWEWVKKEQPAFDLVSIATASGYGVPQNPYNGLEDLDHATRRLFHYIGGDLKGTSEVPANIYPTFTALTDTADAHIKAMLRPIASGQRYQLVGGFYDYKVIIGILRRRLPDQAWRLPHVEGDGLHLPPCFKVDCSKVKKHLGMNFRTLEDTIVEEAEFLYAFEEQTKRK